LIVTNQF